MWTSQSDKERRKASEKGRKIILLSAGASATSMRGSIKPNSIPAKKADCGIQSFSSYPKTEATHTTRGENQAIFSFGFFKNLNELMVFMKESTKNR